MQTALIIFVRNAVLGKVKTRLASSVGNEKALEVYRHLLQHTRAITQNVSAAKFIFYADFINENDLWDGYEKRLQNGSNLGSRMQNAFEELFNAGFTGLCVIGSDCYELTTDIINEGFKSLNTCQAVIGPANDGGYYLLGMQSPCKDVFSNIEWSSKDVLSETINKINALSLSYYSLPRLNDIDEEKDLRHSAIAYLLDK